jgi:hypothetical protein
LLEGEGSPDLRECIELFFIANHNSLLSSWENSPHALVYVLAERAVRIHCHVHTVTIGCAPGYKDTPRFRWPGHLGRYSLCRPLSSSSVIDYAVWHVGFRWLSEWGAVWYDGRIPIRGVYLGCGVRSTLFIHRSHISSVVLWPFSIAYGAQRWSVPTPV